MNWSCVWELPYFIQHQPYQSTQLLVIYWFTSNGYLTQLFFGRFLYTLGYWEQQKLNDTKHAKNKATKTWKLGYSVDLGRKKVYSLLWKSRTENFPWNFKFWILFLNPKSPPIGSLDSKYPWSIVIGFLFAVEVSF
jgi:hypothetical protein